MWSQKTKCDLVTYHCIATFNGQKHCSSRYNVFDLPFGAARPRDQRILRLYGRKLQIVCNYRAVVTIGIQAIVAIGIVAIGIVVVEMFLTYNVTSCNLVFKGLCDYMDGSFSEVVET